MPRFVRRHPRVRELVERRLFPLFLVEGSVNALCDRLNAGLRAQNQTGTVYPNRIHGLFSDDDNQSVNENTLVTLERAAEAIWTDPELAGEKVQKAVEQLRASAVKRIGSGRLTPEAVTAAAEDLGYPAAVAACLVDRADLGLVSADRIRPTLPPDRQGVPDWSFQDKACEQCLAALARGRARRVGLIVPTGAGKTRIALRIALSFLARHPVSTAPVVWVTHRRNLRRQAHRELQKMLAAGGSDLPPDAAALFAKRIDFCMVSELDDILADTGNLPLLLIVDEAHHAAARSYEPIFRDDLGVPGLFLTATPNRTDALPIGIDEIAFTITYRELAVRGVILIPEFRDFPVDSFTWSPKSIEGLADYVITNTADGFRKVLVLAPRLDQVEEFHATLLARLAREDNHPLTADDIGYVHSKGNSLGCDNDDFLQAFEPKPRAILVSAQLLLEGFDDPSIDTVVITYPSESLIVLMQAAGRCVRYAPGKTAAYVVQAKNEKLAYHFDQRWLYQEISDYLRPQLIDVSYRSREELVSAVTDVLERHRVDTAVRERILERLPSLEPGDRCRVLLTGLPYYGAKAAFDDQATWGAVLELADNSETVRGIFNGFSAEGAALSDPTNYLAHVAPGYGIPRDSSAGSEWRGYMEMLVSMFRASQEVYGGQGIFQDQDHRPYERYRSTTWLRYVAFHYRPSVPTALDGFLQDCYNREAILAAYQAEPDAYALLIKIPLPLDGFEAHLLSPQAATWLRATLTAVRTALLAAPPSERCSVLDAERARLPGVPMPLRVVSRIDWFLPEAGFRDLSLNLPPKNEGPPGANDLADDAQPNTQDTDE